MRDLTLKNAKMRRLIWMIVAITLIWCLAIAFDAVPGLRGFIGKHEWRWKYRPGFVPIRLIGPLLMGGILAGWYGLAKRQERVTAWLLVALIPLGMALQMSVHYLHPNGLQLVARVLNPAYYGYYPPATEHRDLGDFVDHYAENQASLTVHEQVHPPGNVVFLGLVLRAVEAIPAVTNLATPYIEPRLSTLPDWITDYTMSEIVGGGVVSLLIPLTGTLAVIPIFLFAREAFGETIARRMGVLYVLMPALTLFEPKMNIPYTLFTGLLFWLAHRAVRDANMWLIYLVGLICSLGNFMSYSMPLMSIVMAVFIFVTSLSTWREDRAEAIKRTLARMGILLLGGLSVQIAAALFFGFDQIESIRVMLTVTAKYNVVRNYWAALFYTPYDLLIFAGIPAAILLLMRIFRLIREAVRSEWPPLPDFLLFGGLVAMALIMLSGVQKSENARVFLYMIPIVVMFGTAESGERQINEREFAIIAALTFVQLIVMQVVWEVYR